jgi:hypothetical protein
MAIPQVKIRNFKRFIINKLEVYLAAGLMFFAGLKIKHPGKGKFPYCGPFLKPGPGEGYGPAFQGRRFKGRTGKAAERPQ